jgi:hypothetical protein
LPTLSEWEIEKLNPHDIKENPASWYLWNDGFKAALKELTKPKGRKWNKEKEIEKILFKRTSFP